MSCVKVLLESCAIKSGTVVPVINCNNKVVGNKCADFLSFFVCNHYPLQSPKFYGFTTGLSGTTVIVMIV